MADKQKVKFDQRKKRFMKYDHFVRLKLPVYPEPFKVRSTDTEKVSLIAGLILLAGGIAFFVFGEVIAAAVFGLPGILLSLYFVHGLIEYASGVAKNKEFFKFIHDEVKKEADVSLSNALIAAMWNEGTVKKGFKTYRASERKGKEFVTIIY